ncbi:MAG: SIS domain-containing protein, partial [Chloroflexi bacterium]|nr:SIS domain-containing protein [Chloroflexota bacterium]
GYEISVPATKTFVNQAVLFLYLAYRLAGRGSQPLDALPALLAQTLEQANGSARQVAAYLDPWPAMHYLGYGITHPIALEAALKLKEITYAHCEGMLSSEFKHGPLSAVRDGYPVLFVTAPGDEAMTISHVNEVTTRGGRAIAIATAHSGLQANVNDYLALPTADRFFTPILAAVAVQMVAYHMSVGRGIDPDFPRNLSKTLTVD